MQSQCCVPMEEGGRELWEWNLPCDTLRFSFFSHDLWFQLRSECLIHFSLFSCGVAVFWGADVVEKVPSSG